MSTRIDLSGDRGRWIRRGGSIILLPDRSPAFTGMEGEVSGGVTATTAGVIDPRIDVFAQRALLRMNASPDPAARADAAAMLAAVKSGALAGIYKEDEQVPALRAKKLGMGWWQVIPPAEDAVLFMGPAAEAPLIDFRDRVRSNPARLDPALRKAWASFQALQRWRGAGARCQTAGVERGGPVAELGRGATRLAGIVPTVLCQVPFATQQRICIFYGYSGAKGDGTVERDLSHQLVAQTLARHLRGRFPGDQIDVICAWHKNIFVNTLISSPLTIRQIHYVGHGSPGGLFFGYNNAVSVKQRTALDAAFNNRKNPKSKLSAAEKRKEALLRDSGLMSGFFTDALPPALLARIKDNLSATALMQVWGCFAGAAEHTYDNADSYWKLFNAAGAPVHGIARDIAESLGIRATAVTDPDTVHGMNFWFRDSSGAFHTNKRPQRLPQWLWPARKAVRWVTWNAAGTSSGNPISFMGRNIDPATVPPGQPPKWFTDEMPLAMAAATAPPLPTCSAAFVAV